MAARFSTIQAFADSGNFVSYLISALLPKSCHKKQEKRCISFCKLTSIAKVLIPLKGVLKRVQLRWGRVSYRMVSIQHTPKRTKNSNIAPLLLVERPPVMIWYLGQKQNSRGATFTRCDTWKIH
jgi:hypothetical protein